MTEKTAGGPRDVAADEDPVCGMHVDPEAARARGLTHDHEGRTYLFCSRGCLLDFKDDPASFLEAGYSPSM